MRSVCQGGWSTLATIVGLAACVETPPTPPPEPQAGAHEESVSGPAVVVMPLPAKRPKLSGHLRLDTLAVEPAEHRSRIRSLHTSRDWDDLLRCAWQEDWHWKTLPGTATLRYETDTKGIVTHIATTECEFPEPLICTCLVEKIGRWAHGHHDRLSIELRVTVTAFEREESNLAL